MLFQMTYYDLGSLLELKSEFPEPKDLFSGATWISLYTSFAVTGEWLFFLEKNKYLWTTMYMRFCFVNTVELA